MTRQEFEALLQALAQGWKEKDYERVASFFAEDVRYLDPTRYSFASRAELLEFFGGEESEESTVWHNILFDEERQLGAAEYTYQGTSRYHGTVWIQLRGNSIARWREYQHTSDLEWEEFWAAM
jgi:SnoaL-like protein